MTMKSDTVQSGVSRGDGDIRGIEDHIGPMTPPRRMPLSLPDMLAMAGVPTGTHGKCLI